LKSLKRLFHGCGFVVVSSVLSNITNFSQTNHKIILSAMDTVVF